MRSRGVLLVVLVAAVAAAAQGIQAASFYSKVASCVAEEAKKEAINSIAKAVGIAQADGGAKATVDFYTVGFAPGIGCFLTSMLTYPPNPDAAPGDPEGKPYYQAGSIVAVSPQVSAANANQFTCKFSKSSAAFTAAQASNLIKYSPLTARGNVDDPASVFRLPAQLSDLKDKVRCTYVLYGKSGFNYTDGRTCVPTGDPFNPENCTYAKPFDAPSIQWHFDKDNKPAASNFTSNLISITCKVDRTLLNRKDTELASGPNDGSCFPASARVITPAGAKPIAQLVVGDKVLAVDAATGKAVFDYVYLTPHRDSAAAAAYLNIHATPVGGQGSSKVLTLSPMHYMPTACDAAQQQQCLKHARAVAVGDLVWLLQGQQAQLARVDGVTSSLEQGMFSPWTLSGSIVVEGFAASTHTAWPYEAQLLQLLPRKHAVAAQHLLAQAHHAVQAPLRAVYHAFGKSPLAVLDDVIFSVVEGVKAPGGGLAGAVRAAVQASAAA